MRIKSLITLILTVCLAVITSNAMAKSDKSGKSDKSAKSEKSAKSAKSDKSGKGNGHCKSTKRGKGHKKKRGRGHRDCDDGPVEPPALVCFANVEETIREEEQFDIETLESLGFVTVSITYAGQICSVEAALPYQEDVFADGGATLCEYSAGDSSLSDRIETETEFSYDMTAFLNCSTYDDPGS